MSRTTGPYSGKDEEQLMARLWSPEIKFNPYNFVMFAFPWGQKGTPLEKYSGPRTWQKEELLAIAEHMQKNLERMKLGLLPEVYQSATASGRGPGKSALVAWLNLWTMSCQLGATCINTANTEDQLKSRTWAEVGKWHTLAINSHWFEKMALSLRPAPWFEKALKDQLKVDTGYFYAQAQLWSEEKPDSFAGVHNHYGVLVVFDEASGIPKPIWTVTEGFFTEPVLFRFWFAFSNPRRNTGAFFECFNSMRNFWRRRNLDSRTVEGVDHAVLNNIVLKYGEDSDEARVEVKGQFPRQGDKQFISREIVDQARLREVELDHWAPLIMGVDPARYGDDATVIRFRQGRNARVHVPVVLKGADNMAVANKCAELINGLNPEAVCIDAGAGSGIIDRLRELGFKIYEVAFGGKAEENEWGNRRTELWSSMRTWLGGGAIDDSTELIEDLPGPEYRYMAGSDKIILEPKEEMKKRGLASPNHGDALALTFAAKVARRDLSSRRGSMRNRVADGVDYNIFGA